MTTCEHQIETQQQIINLKKINNFTIGFENYEKDKKMVLDRLTALENNNFTTDDDVEWDFFIKYARLVECCHKIKSKNIK